MKAINTLLISALCSLAIGILVLLFPESIAEWLVRVIGGLFLIPGLVSILVYWGRKHSTNAKEANVALPLTGIGSMLLGGFLIGFPELVKEYMVYVIAVFPAVFSLNQMAYLWRVKSSRAVGGGFFVWPLLVILGAVGVCLNPIDSAPELLLTIAAILCLLYALTELFNLLYFRREFKVVPSTIVLEEELMGTSPTELENSADKVSDAQSSAPATPHTEKAEELTT